MVKSDMCDINQQADKCKDGFDLSLTCKQSGKPISKSNKWGMFCEDLCDMDKQKAAYIKCEKMMQQFDTLFASLGLDISSE